MNGQRISAPIEQQDEPALKETVVEFIEQELIRYIEQDVARLRYAPGLLKDIKCSVREVKNNLFERMRFNPNGDGGTIHKNLDSHKLAALTTVLILRYLPLYDRNDRERRLMVYPLNAELAVRVACSIIVTYQLKGYSDDVKQLVVDTLRGRMPFPNRINDTVPIQQSLRGALYSYMFRGNGISVSIPNELAWQLAHLYFFIDASTRDFVIKLADAFAEAISAKKQPIRAR